MMPKILVVCHYYPPEVGAPQARIGELSRFWAQTGADVTVLTGMPNHPTGVVPAAYQGVKRCVERTEGVKVVRTWLYATANEGIVKKTLAHLSFMVTSVLFGFRKVGRPDVVMVSSPTFFSIFSGWLIAKLKRARLIVEIRDLWPAIFVELGVLTNKQVIWLLERIELFFYRSADHVVTVTEGFREDLIRRGIPADRVTTITNGVDLDVFQPAEADPAVRHKLGAKPGEALALYIGAHGISHGLTSVADAAARLEADGIHVAFVGDGAAKQKLVNRVAELHVDNITLLPSVPRDEVPPIVSAADICIVPLRDVALFSSFIPSKIFEFLGAGKAVVGAVRGEPARILRDAGATVVDPEDPVALAEAILDLAKDPERRAAQATAGRLYVAEHFDRRKLASRYLELMTRIARGGTQ
jgi:glycosyltransferase involved in cell wall biosynthesis